MFRKARVVIADDEQHLCTLIKNIIHWDELDIELEDIVSNGRELYDVIIKKQPEIVITDICMPEMDGIELIRLIRQKGIACHFIIVSGYRQFEYAHEALKYNVEDYILKPIDEGELNERLHDIVVRLNERTDESALADGQEGVKRFFFRHVLRDLHNKPLSLEQVQQEYGISLKEGFFQTVCIALDVTSPQKSQLNEQSDLQKKIASSLKRIMSKVCYNVIVDIDANYIVAGLNYDSSQAESVLRSLEDYFDMICETVNLFVDIRVTLGVGTAHSSLQGLMDSREQALSAVLQRIAVGNGKIIFYDRLPYTGILSQDPYIEEALKDINKACESWNLQLFNETMNRLFARIRVSFDPDGVRNLVHRLLQMFSKVCNELGLDDSQEDYLRKQVFFGLKSATTFDALERAVTDPILTLMTEMHAHVNNRRIRPVRQAIAYIEDNYDQTIRLEDIADIVNLSTAYLSNLFSKEMNISLSDYIIKVRMDKAKQYLRTTDMSINEIAEKTGYSDSKYFSKLFRREVGIKPTEYRKTYG